MIKVTLTIINQLSSHLTTPDRRDASDPSTDRCSAEASLTQAVCSGCSCWTSCWQRKQQYTDKHGITEVIMWQVRWWNNVVRSAVDSVLYRSLKDVLLGFVCSLRTVEHCLHLQVNSQKYHQEEGERHVFYHVFCFGAIHNIVQRGWDLTICSFPKTVVMFLEQ